MKCSDCHDPHGTFQDKQLKSTPDQNAVCTKCHTETAGPFVYEHPVIKTEGCTTCHSPHGSPNARLLNVGNVNTLCLQCHSETNMGAFHMRYHLRGRFTIRRRNMWLARIVTRKFMARMRARSTSSEQGSHDTYMPLLGTRRAFIPIFYPAIVGGIALALLLLTAVGTAQDAPQGIVKDGYTIRQTAELGGHIVERSGSGAMYDTLVNLQSGPRVLGQTYEMHAVPGTKHLLFDTLFAASNGYGGDPNNFVTLRMSKGKLYDFQGLFRRDRQYMDYTYSITLLFPLEWCRTAIPSLRCSTRRTSSIPFGE